MLSSPVEWILDHSKWHARYQKRALRSERYREIRDQNTIEGSSLIKFDSETWDEERDLFDKMNSGLLRPNSRPIMLNIRWWLGKHPFIDSPIREFKFAWRRYKDGWTPQDTWGLDNYLSEIIIGSVRHLNEVKHGWPGEPLTYEEWGQILDDIVAGFEAGQTIQSEYLGEGYTPEGYEGPSYEELMGKFDHGMELLHKWFFHLWD
jgi:hypothetical protein